MNFEILKTELADATYSAMSDAEAATELNAVDKAVKLAISTHDVKAYL